MWRKVKGDVGGEEVWGRCGKVYGVNMKGVGKCVGVWREVGSDVGKDMEMWRKVRGNVEGV